MPQISVIVPVYKVEPYLRRCVDSVLAQTFKDFELILVDDGSPDSCPAICDEYAMKDNRVNVIHQQNSGLSAARNAGIDWAFANSDSEWIFFIDSDDWIHPASLEVLMRAAKETNLSVVIGGYELTKGEDPVVDVEHLTAEVWNTEDYYRNHNINATVPWGKIYKKECFEGIRYPLKLVHEDEYVTYKILFKDTRIGFIAQPLYAYYRNPNGIMGVGFNSKTLDNLGAFRERITFFKDREMREMYYWSVHQYFYFILAYTKDTGKDRKNKELLGLHWQLIKLLIKELWTYRKDLRIRNYIHGHLKNIFQS